MTAIIFTDIRNEKVTHSDLQSLIKKSKILQIVTVIILHQCRLRHDYPPANPLVAI